MSAETPKAPAFLKMTDKVRAGLRYAAVSLEFDVAHPPAEAVQVAPYDDEALSAAAAWIRYQLGKRDQEATS